MNKMLARYAETLVPNYKTTQRHIAEDRNPVWKTSGMVMHITKYEWHELGAAITTATSVHTNTVPQKCP